MNIITLSDLQASVRDRSAFNKLSDYRQLGQAFLSLLELSQPTRIISPSQNHYIFYQYDEETSYRITRPLNTQLFIENVDEFTRAFDRFGDFLADLRKYEDKAATRPDAENYLRSGEINRVVYTAQQIVGCIGDSFPSPNQSRKRVGQIFEQLVRLIIHETGVHCDTRRITVPIPGVDNYQMSYELDLVFSRDKAILTSETKYIHPSEVVGSVKTTSKDRLDKIFLDKYLLTQFLGREIPVIAIFLHDVQRAKRGNSIFGINATFKSNHFLGYSVALNRLDGVYYVDPRPEMVTNPRLSAQIRDFQYFLVYDLWTLSAR